MRIYVISPEKYYEVVKNIETLWTCSKDRYTPYPASSRRYEVHQRFIDIQFLEQGEELIHIAQDVPAKTFTDASKDCLFYDTFFRPDASVMLRPRVFCIIFPNEAHMPCIQTTDTPSPVVKRVAKVPFASFTANPLLFDQIFGYCC